MAPVKHFPKDPGRGGYTSSKPRWIDRGIQGEFYFALKVWMFHLIYLWPGIALVALLYFIFKK